MLIIFDSIPYNYNYSSIQLNSTQLNSTQFNSTTHLVGHTINLVPASAKPASPFQYPSSLTSAIPSPRL
ncbi:hypothetical protein EYC80_007610 [Monilinia laxa]|uniref:Uncharacterized protein n=1 Tax=Monilinia laxa TaxID=61186 RepID=A0A5N6JWP4_MONLA|nr:hypothetical protein EYC80_007610 [Monilinia laxa]